MYAAVHLVADDALREEFDKKLEAAVKRCSEIPVKCNSCRTLKRMRCCGASTEAEHDNMERLRKARTWVLTDEERKEHNEQPGRDKENGFPIFLDESGKILCKLYIHVHTQPMQ